MYNWFRVFLATVILVMWILIKVILLKVIVEMVILVKVTVVMVILVKVIVVMVILVKVIVVMVILVKVVVVMVMGQNTVMPKRKKQQHVNWALYRSIRKLWLFGTIHASFISSIRTPPPHPTLVVNAPCIGFLEFPKFKNIYI